MVLWLSKTTRAVHGAAYGESNVAAQLVGPYTCKVNVVLIYNNKRPGHMVD